MRIGLCIRGFAGISGGKVRRRDDKICRRSIRGARDIIEYADSEERLDIDVVRLRMHRIPKKENDVDFLLRDERAQFEIAAQWPRFQLLNVRRLAAALLNRVFDKGARGAGARKVVLAKRLPVKFDPFDEIGFAIIVRD